MTIHYDKLHLRQSVIYGLTEAIIGNGQGEICGVLLGTVHDGIGTAERVITLANTDSRTGWFGILDSDIERVMRCASQKKMHLVTVFHSHLSGNLDLSQADRAALSESDLPWLIFTYEHLSSTLAFSAYTARECTPISVRILDN